MTSVLYYLYIRKKKHCGRLYNSKKINSKSGGFLNMKDTIQKRKSYLKNYSILSLIFLLMFFYKIIYKITSTKYYIN